MLHKFVEFYMVIINRMLHTYIYIKLSFKKVSLISLFVLYSHIQFFDHVVHSNCQLLLFIKVWKVYARTLGLSLSIFHHSSPLLDRYDGQSRRILLYLFLCYVQCIQLHQVFHTTRQEAVVVVGSARCKDDGGAPLFLLLLQIRLLVSC